MKNLIRLVAAAAVVASLCSALAESVAFQNDFSTRISADAMPSDQYWTEYTYDKGGPAAYDYLQTSSFNAYTTPYEWQSSSVPFTQQDGWLKKSRGSGNAYVNMGLSVISKDENPALTLTNSKDTNRPSTNRLFAIVHPLRNVFKKGDVRLQFDVFAPNGYASSGIYCWLGLICEQQLKHNYEYSLSKWPFEVGYSSSVLSGGWRKDGSASGTRGFYTYGNYTKKHWYRYDVMVHLDTSTFDMDVYDLGEERIDIDASPTGEPVVSKENQKLVFDMNDNDGGIAGIGIVMGFYDTVKSYGEDGYTDDRAGKFDNIKVSYRAPSESALTECYRNTFDRSMRRTVDGSAKKSHAYEYNEAVETNTVWMISTYLRAVNNYSTDTAKVSTAAPFLSTYFDSLKGQPQPIGYDGWRHAGDSSYTGPLSVTTNGSNWVFFPSTYSMHRQPMCPQVTSGKFKFEFDQRMPAGWNGTPRCEIDLMSAEAYKSGVQNVNESIVRVGLAGKSVSPAGTAAAPNKTFTVYLEGAYKTDQMTAFEPLTWYRIQVIGDLDTRKYNVYFYRIGANAPETPTDFTASENTANAIAKYENVSMGTPAKYNQGIYAWGISNWQQSKCTTGESVANYCMYIDNVRFWKQVGGVWQQLFQNTCESIKRMGYTKRYVNLTPTSYIDRPEYGVDRFASAPTYANGFYAVGKDAVHEVKDKVYSVVQPIGRNITKGKVSMQYDVRIPTTWRPANINYFWVQFGGPTMLSASTWTTPKYRYQMHPAISTGLQTTYSGSNPAVGIGKLYNRTGIITKPGSDGKGGYTTKANHLAESFGGWVRIKVEADMDTHRYDMTAYKMGDDHPTFATPDGDVIMTWTDLGFMWNDEPISAIHIIGGYMFSYAPWEDSPPGGILLDNIRIRHGSSGFAIFYRMKE